MLYGMEYPWLVWVMCLFGSPLYLLCTPNLFSGRTGWETNKALVLCRHYSVTATTSVHYQYCFGQKSKPQDHMSCYEESQLYPSQAQHNTNQYGWIWLKPFKAYGLHIAPKAVSYTAFKATKNYPRKILNLQFCSLLEGNAVSFFHFK